MTIRTVSVSNFRNLESQKLSFDQNLNFIYGENGSGKSSLLEAIYMATTVRSFRTRKAEHICQHGAPTFTLFAELETNSNLHKIGIERGKAHSITRLNGQNIRTSSEVAQIVPTAILEPGSFNILSSGPKDRRRFLDWGVFHVEQKMMTVWTSFNSLLKQRNSLLRHDKIDHSQLDIWTVDFCRWSESLDELRLKYFELFKSTLYGLMDTLGFYEDLECIYYRGWDEKKELKEVLEKNIQLDLKQRFTGFGPQRCDIKFRVAGKSATEFYSRGRQKLLVIVLFITQLKLLKQISGKDALLLIDDIGSELDKKILGKVFEYFLDLDVQIICTSVLEPADYLNSNLVECGKLFHVEQGNFESMT